MEDYAVVVSTFLRPEKLRSCLDHVVSIATPPVEVVVADDSGDREENDAVYADFESRLDLTVRELPYDEGLSSKRNEGLTAVTTDYVLLLDDDQYVPSNVHELLAILEADPDLGGIAPYWEEHGSIRANAADYTLENGWLVKTASNREPETTDRGRRYFVYDHIPTAAMFRTAVFEDYTWDEAFTIYEEDTDFYYSHRELGRWQFAITPNYVLQHDPGRGSIDRFGSERTDLEKMRASYRRLQEKFGWKGVFHFGSHLPPQRSTLEQVTLRASRHLVPNRLLWWAKIRGIGAGVDR